MEETSFTMKFKAQGFSSRKALEANPKKPDLTVRRCVSGRRLSA